MSTRAAIGVQTANGLRTIYNHYDGYPGHVGKILKAFHNSAAAVEALLEGAHIRNFDLDGTVVRFGEGDGAAEEYADVAEALETVYDYVYLYGADGWKCYGRDRTPYYKNIIEYAIP